MHHAIESHGAIVTAELVPWGTGRTATTCESMMIR
jgi:hypothetical protein